MSYELLILRRAGCLFLDSIPKRFASDSLKGNMYESKIRDCKINFAVTFFLGIGYFLL